MPFVGMARHVLAMPATFCLMADASPYHSMWVCVGD